MFSREEGHEEASGRGGKAWLAEVLTRGPELLEPLPMAAFRAEAQEKDLTAFGCCFYVSLIFFLNICAEFYLNIAFNSLYSGKE